jgi:hypothetical protein
VRTVSYGREDRGLRGGPIEDFSYAGTCLFPYRIATGHSGLIHSRSRPKPPRLHRDSRLHQSGRHHKIPRVALGLNKQVTIILDSPGGTVDDAIYIGEFVRSRNWDTLVQSNAICNSACTMIWLAGTGRSLGNRARLGFHSASSASSGAPNRVRSERGNAKMAKFMAAMGIPQELIDFQPKADPCCINYVDYAQAQAWNC